LLLWAVMAVAMVGLLHDDSLFVVALLFIGSYLVLLFNFARKLHARTILSVNCTTKRYKSGCFSWTTLVAIFNSTYKMSQTGTIPCGPSHAFVTSNEARVKQEQHSEAHLLIPRPVLVLQQVSSHQAISFREAKPGPSLS
jgi:hypothetical protein